jgi:hypothetical protein
MRQSIQDIIRHAKQQPKLGMADITDLADQFKNAADALGSNSNVALAGIGKLNELVKDLATSYTTAANNTKFLDDATKGLRDSFGLNIKDATLFYGRLTDIAAAFDISATKLAAYSKNLKGVVGIYSNLSKGISAGLEPLLKTQQLLQNNLGLSGDVANKMTMYSAMNNTSTANMLDNQQKIADNLTNQFGVQVTLKDIISEVATVTEDLQLQYGKIPGALEVAAVRAKTLGFSMSQLHKTGEGLLNIQSSIGDELEYQLLSGRRLIGDATANEKLQGKSLTNAYREATLRGDANEQMNIMNQLVSQEGETIRNNLFARQQLAKTLGTDEATLARTLAKQKLLKDLNAEMLVNMSPTEMTAAIRDLPGFKELNPEEQKAKLDELMKINDTRSAEDKMADYLETMVSKGIRLLAGPEELSKIADDAALQKEAGLRAGYTNYDTVMNTGNAGIAGTLTVAMNNISTAVDLFKDVFTGITNPLAASKIDNPIDLTAETVVLSTSATSMNDGVVGPGSGKILFNGPEGAIKFSDNDYITASTNNPMSGGGGWAQVVAAIEAQTRALANATPASSINPDYWT